MKFVVSYGLTFKKIFAFDYLPAIIFVIFSVIVILSEVIGIIRGKKLSRVICVFGATFSNFIIMLMLLSLSYRMQFSWVVTTAFMGLYIYQKLYDKGFIRWIMWIGLVMTVVFQTKELNQSFYDDYRRYENEKWVANDVAINVMKNCDYKNKPLLCIMQGGKDNHTYLLEWGVSAFNDYQTEITRFINYQGYDFLYITREKAEKTYIKYYNELDVEAKNQYIIELDDVIIVNMGYYEF